MSNETKQCPYCAKDIKVAAIVCKHCRRDLPIGSVDVTPITETQRMAAELPIKHEIQGLTMMQNRVETYTGNHAAAAKKFDRDMKKLSEHDWEVVAQSYESGSWGLFGLTSLAITMLASVLAWSVLDLLTAAIVFIIGYAISLVFARSGSLVVTYRKQPELLTSGNIAHAIVLAFAQAQDIDVGDTDSYQAAEQPQVQLPSDFPPPEPLG